MQTKLVSDLSDRHGIGEILFVGKHEELGIAEFIFAQHFLKLFRGLSDTFAIVRVDHKDETLGVLKVMAPQRTNLVLATDIPD